MSSRISFSLSISFPKYGHNAQVRVNKVGISSITFKFKEEDDIIVSIKGDVIYILDGKMFL